MRKVVSWLAPRPLWKILTFEIHRVKLHVHIPNVLSPFPSKYLLKKILPPPPPSQEIHVFSCSEDNRLNNIKLYLYSLQFIKLPS